MRFIITAGPTREPLDPVRFLTNRSSGRMGYAIAGAAVHEGHRALLISGPTSLEVPAGVDFIPVETAQEMYDAVKYYSADADAAVLCAAVADYRPVSVAEHKIKKSGDNIMLELEKTPDILGSMRDVFGFGGVLIGFAAETDHLVEYAREKLLRKKCDLIVANDVSRKDIGFDSRENEVTFIYRDGEKAVPKASKHMIALDIINEAVRLARPE